MMYHDIITKLIVDLDLSFVGEAEVCVWGGVNGSETVYCRGCLLIWERPRGECVEMCGRVRGCLLWKVAANTGGRRRVQIEDERWFSKESSGCLPVVVSACAGRLQGLVCYTHGKLNS